MKVLLNKSILRYAKERNWQTNMNKYLGTVLTIRESKPNYVLLADCQCHIPHRFITRIIENESDKTIRGVSNNTITSMMRSVFDNVLLVYPEAKKKGTRANQVLSAIDNSFICMYNFLRNNESISFDTKKGYKGLFEKINESQRDNRIRFSEELITSIAIRNNEYITFSKTSIGVFIVFGQNGLFVPKEKYDRVCRVFEPFGEYYDAFIKTFLLSLYSGNIRTTGYREREEDDYNGHFRIEDRYGRRVVLTREVYTSFNTDLNEEDIINYCTEANEEVLTLNYNKEIPVISPSIEHLFSICDDIFNVSTLLEAEEENPF